MSLEGHTEAVWCVKMMVDQGLMLTGFSLTFSVSKNIAGRYCKMHKLKLANVLTMFSMMLYFQQKYVQFDVIQFWGRNIKNYGLNHVLFYFLTFCPCHESIIKVSVKEQFLLLLNLSKKLIIPVTKVKTNVSAILGQLGICQVILR